MGGKRKPACSRPRSSSDRRIRREKSNSGENGGPWGRGGRMGTAAAKSPKGHKRRARAQMRAHIVLGGSVHPERARESVLGESRGREEQDQAAEDDGLHLLQGQARGRRGEGRKEQRLSAESEERREAGGSYGGAFQKRGELASRTRLAPALGAPAPGPALAFPLRQESIK